MSTEVTIRPFTKAKDDQKEIKSIFAAGMHDIVGRGWRKYYLSQLTNVYLPLHFLHTSLSLVSFLRPRSSVSTCKSSLLSCFMWNIALIMLPPIGWYALFKIAVSKYINSSFKNDLSDINAHYIEPEHRMSNFWVALKDAQSDEVIGTAAIEVHFKMPADFPQKAVVRRSSSQSLHHGSNPQLDQAGATLMRRYSTKPTGELRRLSVKKSHRNKGTAKKLLATAVDFCKKKGMEKVWFSITDLQPAAERLFVEHGFQFMFEHKIVGGLIGIRYYELDLSVPVIDITLNLIDDILVPDYLEPGLDLILCGINPGIQSALKRSHFAGPTNAFWPGLNNSGLIPEDIMLSYETDHLCLNYGIGLTNLVHRPTPSSSGVKTHEFREGVEEFKQKLHDLKPRMVGFVGMSVYRWFINEFKTKIEWGLQSNTFNVGDGHDVSLYVLPSTSGRMTMARDEKMRLFKGLKVALDGLSSRSGCYDDDQTANHLDTKPQRLQTEVAFFEAVEKGDSDKVRQLLSEDKTLVQQKHKSEKYKYLKPLNHQDLDINCEGAYLGSLTPLHVALLKGYDSIAKDIIDSSLSAADLDIQFGGGNTALHLATFLGARDVVKKLLARGADRNIKNNKGFRPIDVLDDAEMREIYNTN